VLVPEGLNESSPVRSAGLAFKKAARSRTGRSTAAYAGKAACERPGAARLLSSRAGRTSLCIVSQHFVLGYFHRVPLGRLLAAYIPFYCVEAHAKASKG
jgi:hypothetical protein